MGEIFYGALDSGIDERDYTLNMLVNTTDSNSLPLSYRTETTVPVFTQGSTSTCVACAAATCRYIQEELQEGSAEQFSVNYIYGNRLNGSTGEGMSIRNGIEALLKFGDCHWNDFPGYDTYENANTAYKENAEVYDDSAYPYKINSYYRLYTTDEIKTAIYNLGCVVFSINTYTSFDSPDKNGYVEYDDTQSCRGRHAVVVIGWTADDHWIVLNSWGEKYGDNGYCYLSFEYPFNEAWAMVDDNRYEKLIFERDVDKAISLCLGIKKSRYLC